MFPPSALLRVFAISVAITPAFAQPAISYNRDVRPILSDNCFLCHGPDKETRDSGLRLDIRDEAVKAAESGDIAIVPGNVEASKLVMRILSDDRDEIMPPPKAHKKLTAEQKDILKQWIAEGAQYETHWAYTPLLRPEVPPAEGAGAPIDAFIRARLAQEKIKPSAAADRRTLIRRLYLDLIGVPPSVEDVEAFASASSPAAYTSLVDGLLASPMYGERMAQQWLDLARYADTVGYHGDQNQNVWAYRDWVIKAFNQNKPFDQFTIEQLAGDLLPNPTPDQLTATCFNRLNMVTREGGAQPKEYLAKYTADRIRTVGTTWLGSTLGCAECHDHKFDPWTQEDFYSIGAFFADVKQWGVYSDYSYTPNPDLKGFNNDFPFPPEIVVESEALKQRMAGIERRVMELVSVNPAPGSTFEDWHRQVSEFLKKNKDGWEKPKATVKVTTSPEEAKQGGDGRITIQPKLSRDIQIDLSPASRTIAAIRIELLPDSANENGILRSGTNETEKPVFEIVRPKGKAAGVGIRHAQANHYDPRFRNGQEVIGVHGGWKLDPKNLKQAHVAVFHPEEPIALAEGDLLRIRLLENHLANVRVSTSPLATADLHALDFPKDIAAQLNDPEQGRKWHLRSTGWNKNAFAELKKLDDEWLDCRGGKTPVLVTQSTDKPLPIRLLPRGNWQDESGEILSPRTPEFLPALSGSKGRKLTRLDLAKWIVAPDNPLTARVVMNRLWRQFFGNGLSAQLDDLGAQGEMPSHPELLDWLAVEFRESWDMKKMVRLIVHSDTYKQVADLRPELRDRDPQNRLLASQNPRRLDAEFIRDNALAIAGLLNLEMGGPAVKPYQPDGYYDALQFPNRQYTADASEDQWRRGVYMHWQRTFLHPMLANFDAPSREDCIAIRTSANSPQQALTLLNDPTFVEAARTWAARLLETKAANDAERIDVAFKEAVARPAKSKERESLLVMLNGAREVYRAKPENAAKLQQVGFAPAAEGDPVELAAWTSLCRVVLNLHETITRY